MSIDTLDDLGRRAAADLNARTCTIDTEAALASFGSPGGGRLRSGRSFGRPGRPVFLGAAAVLLVVAAVAVGLVVGREDPGGNLATTPGTSVRPAEPGPVVATTVGPDGEQVELHAPVALHDGDQVLVAVTGGSPGDILSVGECHVGVAGSYNPMAHCAPSGPNSKARVAPDGSAQVALRVWYRYDGQAGSRIANRCEGGAGACVLDLDLGPADGGPRAVGPDGRPNFVLALDFAADPEGPPEPTLTASPTVGTPDGRSVPGLKGALVAVAAAGVAPGPTTIWLDVHGPDRLPGPLRFVQPARSVRLADVTVGADGQIDIDLVVPLAVSLLDGGTADQTCGLEGVTCDVRIGYPDPSPLPAEHRWLAPEPVAFP